MAIQFSCPSGHQLNVPDETAGKQIRCPTCKCWVIVPDATDEKGSTNDKIVELELAVDDEDLPAKTVSHPPPLPKASRSPRAGKPGGRRWLRRRRSNRGPLEAKPTEGEPRVGGPVEDEAPPPVPEPPRPEPALSEPSSPQPELLPQPSQSVEPTVDDFPVGAYQADPGRVQTVRWLAAILAGVVVFSAVPAARFVNLETAPGWARAVLLLAALEAVYIAWMLTAPDWASVRVVMLVFLCAAALYAVVTAGVVLASPDDPLPLDLDALRRVAPRWCGSVLLVSFLAAYVCGRTSTRWRRAAEREAVARGKP
ncbi:MAG: hypothetical protein ACYTG0_40200 [Planctomycetota bacterium]|jgi:hypothetical protein